LDGHLTRRQLRVYFAAHEMDERRRCAAASRGKEKGKAVAHRPLYELAEIKTLVGGRGSETADEDLAADLRVLRRLGLVEVAPHAIRFAASVDQIKLDDVSGFWTLFNQVPNPRRTVPVPRRTLRALAGGFSRAVTGVMIALMIRSLFWHGEQDGYRIDGRTKGSWIADVFGLSRRAVTDARAHLIELGWLEPIAARQWELNRWGAHDRINVEWSPKPADAAPAEDGGRVGFASPNADSPAGFASPCLNSLPSPTESLKTKKPGQEPAKTGVCEKSSSKKEEPATTKAVPPNLRDIRPEHLRETSDILALYRQAVDAGLAGDSEAGRLDFIALAERARTRGSNPGGLLRWLLVHKRFDFITQADEDAAAERLRALHHGGKAERRRDEPKQPVRTDRKLTDDEKLVRACLRVAQDRGIADPFWVLRQIKPWTREQWDQAVQNYELAELERWR
jgi:hypothetical protein